MPPMPPKKTEVRTDEINGKPFGFQVQEYKGRMYLVGREMYDDGSGLVFGRNGVNININEDATLQGALDYLANMISTIAEATGLTVEEIINKMGF